MMRADEQRQAIKQNWIVASILVLLLALAACSGAPESDSSQNANTPSSANDQTSNEALGSDEILAELFAGQETGVQVRGEGTVIRLLSDDTEGDQHQRFILELKSGQTLLIAHNIDIAPRLDGIAVGDAVEFFGEYFYNSQGGGIHWTHHDPGKKHVDGWLFWNGEHFG